MLQGKQANSIVGVVLEAHITRDSQSTGSEASGFETDLTFESNCTEHLVPCITTESSQKGEHTGHHEMHVCDPDWDSKESKDSCAPVKSPELLSGAYGLSTEHIDTVNATLETLLEPVSLKLVKRQSLNSGTELQLLWQQ